MPGRIEGRIAFVTGASSGLGRAISLKLASEGAKICCVDLFDSPRNRTNAETGKADDFHNRIEGESTAAEISRLHGDGRATFVKADVTSASDVEAAVAQCVDVFGRLDILCANAGISVESSHVRPHGIHELSERDWDTTMAINAKGVFLCCKHAIAQMLRQPGLPGHRDRGWIVNTASVQGLVAYHHTPAYTASKGAVAQLTKQVALDYAPQRIHVNAVCPGFLRTTMTQNLQNDPVKQAEIDRAHPFGGMGTVEDVAKAVLFLASDDVGWVHGVNLPVDGTHILLPLSMHGVRRARQQLTSHRRIHGHVAGGRPKASGQLQQPQGRRVQHYFVHLHQSPSTTTIPLKPSSSAGFGCEWTLQNQPGLSLPKTLPNARKTIRLSNDCMMCSSSSVPVPASACLAGYASPKLTNRKNAALTPGMYGISLCFTHRTMSL